jgi:toxin-antitoxin system PIN domain toxin
MARPAVALLDVNVLIALFDPDHVHHEIAHDWFEDHRASGWATCPLTENGFVRVLGNLARTGQFVPIPDLVDRLRTFCASGHHEFWPDVVSLRDEQLFDLSVARGHRQLTDVYLLGLAVKRRGHLATFDQKLPLASVKGARRDMLDVLSAE